MQTFTGANKELEKRWKVLEGDQTKVVLSERKIQWKFIVDRAPWRNGV